ncbi:MAG: hypothetical protein RIC19_21840 [Phaeodactylibacter sp.]|uniref:hypothetical protein n=1 Tax=Phaeodactylibacter sp. TaxID=1940289 RepID=UPI0032ED8FDB
MRTQSKAFRAIFLVISVAVIGIWLALILTEQIGIIGNLVFLGGAAWIFELYSAAQREGFDRPSPPRENRRRRPAKSLEDYSL